MIRQGLELFNRGEFFACHEVLEQAWLGAREEKKLFIQGLIQIAVGYYHLRRANPTGAARLLSAGMVKLQANSTSQSWVDSAALLAAVEPVVQALRAGRASADTPQPRIAFTHDAAQH